MLPVVKSKTALGFGTTASKPNYRQRKKGVLDVTIFTKSVKDIAPNAKDRIAKSVNYLTSIVAPSVQVAP